MIVKNTKAVNKFTEICDNTYEEQTFSKSSSGTVICIPNYNDWDCVSALLKLLNKNSPNFPQPVHIVLVDDGSTEPLPNNFLSNYLSVAQVDVLQLRRNVGHQRAIALGLAFINNHYSGKLVVVMDGDGEDSPEDIKTLIDRCRLKNFSKIIFASRRKRTESFFFRINYALYRFVHLLLTGYAVKIGNFSVIPAAILPKVVGISEIWNHYAAGIVHARLPIDTIPIDRAYRLTGKSKMNFVSLVTHGMSAISVFGDIVGVRLLCIISFLSLLMIVGIICIVCVRLGTELAIPGWATNAFGLSVIFLLLLQILTTVLVLILLRSRNMTHFLPVRDWENYVASQITIWKR